MLVTDRTGASDDRRAGSPSAASRARSFGQSMDAPEWGRSGLCRSRGLRQAMRRDPDETRHGECLACFDQFRAGRESRAAIAGESAEQRISGGGAGCAFRPWQPFFPPGRSDKPRPDGRSFDGRSSIPSVADLQVSARGCEVRSRAGRRGRPSISWEHHLQGFSVRGTGGEDREAD